MDKRYITIESSEPLGQFIDTSIETLLSGEGRDVKVTEHDPNAINTEQFE